MSYEFNAGDTLSSEYKNPFVVENKLLMLASSLYAAGGIHALFSARRFMLEHADGYALAAAFVALTMLGVSIKLSIQAFSQFRFVYGRGFPIGLAPELKHTQRGTSPEADALQQQLRERSILFEEPKGPLAGLLYSILKPLLAAPPVIQYAAQRHFEALIGMLSVLMSLGISYVLFSGTPHEGIVSWAYLPLTGLTLIKPFLKADDLQPPKDSRVTMLRTAGLVVFAVIGPVLMTRYVPALPVPPMWIAPLTLLLGSIGASGFFFAAVVARIDSAPQTAVSCEQTTIAMNCQPAQLWTAISRDFQQAWARGIPNRQYSSVAPEAQESKGSFNGSVLEETQPAPTNMMQFTGVLQSLKAPHTKPLVWLGLWAVLMAAAAALITVFGAGSFLGMGKMEVSRVVLTLIGLQTATLLAFRIGHVLWSRMYFKSRMTWIEVQGTYQTAELDIGNQVTGNARSRSTVIRIEDAVLRVWVTDIVSVAFGKDSKRFIMGMAPADETAAAMAQRLKQFAAEQSMIVSPTSLRDGRKVAVLNGMNKLMHHNFGAGPAAEQTALLGSIAQEMEWQDGGIPLDASGMQKATVKFFDAVKGFGYLRDEQGIEYRFTGASLGSEIGQVNKGDKVRFQPSLSGRGRYAEKVSPMT